MARIFYHAVPPDWRREQKYHFLETHEDLSKIEWKELEPDKGFNWLTEGMSEDFASFLTLGDKEDGAETVFRLFSNGIKTNRDAWAWNFSSHALAENMKRMIETYNDHVARWPHRNSQAQQPDDFVTYDQTKIAWSRDLKRDMERGRRAEFSEAKIRTALYRPFTRASLFFDRLVNEEVYSLTSLFPIPESELENRAISIPGLGNRQAFGCLATNRITALDLAFEKAQCFPFYTYAEDGSDRRENITDWALEQFRRRYSPAPGASPLTKWDIFYYVYAILHHPQYRERYAANLRRELPRIPFVAAEVTRLTSKAAKEDGASSRRLLQDAEVFHAFAAAGKQLADLHIGYEQAKEYPLTRRENPKAQLNWRVEKMKLINPGRASVPASPDSGRPSEKLGLAGTLALPAPTASIVYNDFLTLEGIPPETFEYRLGNRSALDWVIDQYQVSTDKRSGITNDPNRPDDPQYIVRLIAQVITVSVETVNVVKALPPLDAGGPQ